MKSRFNEIILFLSNERINLRMKKIYIDTFLYLSGFLLFVILSYIMYGLAFRSGLGSDAAVISMAAKNIAFGVGYANSVPFDGSFSVKPFCVFISTGPVLVLPASLLIYIFGNLSWVPGFTTVSTCLFLFFSILFLVRRNTKSTSAVAYTIFFVLFFYIVTADKFFYQWYSLMGELPSALLCILGALLFAAEPSKLSSIVASSFVFGLAFMTKFLALLGFIPIILYLIFRLCYNLIQNNGDQKNSFHDLIYSCLSFILPFCFFEIYKICALGILGYSNNIHDLFSFINTQNRISSPIDFSSWLLTVLGGIPPKAELFLDTFKCSVLILFLISIVVGILVFRYSKYKFSYKLFLILISGAVTHLFWWFLFAKDSPRYALIGLFLYFAAISTIVLIDSSRKNRLILSCSLLFFFALNNEGYNKPFDTYSLLSESQRLSNLKATVEFLVTLEKEAPFVSGWWTTVGEIEYAMPTSCNFIRYDNLRNEDYYRDLILVRDRDWVKFQIFPKFMEWEARCDEVLLDAPPYLVSRCRALKPK